MNYEMLSRKNKHYGKLNDVMKRICFLHLDIFPVLANYKLTDDLDFSRILAHIEEEGPVRILADDRLFPYFNKVDGFHQNDIDFAACKGEWGRYGNLRFFFYHGSVKNSESKILLYNERAILNKQIVIKMA